MTSELAAAELIARFEELGLALAIGLLMGMERSWRERRLDEGERVAGVRTFALIGLIGGICGVFAEKFGSTPLAAGFLAVGGAIGAFQWMSEREAGHVDATPVIAALAAFALGAYAVVGDARAAAAAGVAATALLAMKEYVHGWVERLSWRELRATLLLLAMTLIVLPVLPDADMGPWNALNPRAIWLLTVLIAAVSFAGYFAIRIAGPGAGPMLAGAAGGLASSTAATVSLSKLAKETPAAFAALMGGAMLSNAVMFVRVCVVVGVLRPDILAAVGASLAPAAAVTAGLAFLSWRRAVPDHASAAVDLTNPFSLRTVLQFGALLAVVSLAAGGLQAWLGAGGVYALAAASGLADVDAITLSMSRGASAPAADVAAYAILIAVAVNTAAKAAIGWTAGGRKAGLALAFMTIAAVAAGVCGEAVWLATRPAG